MQIHNYGASQTVLAYNHWGNAGAATSGGTTAQMDLGIGNSPNSVRRTGRC